MNYVTGNLIRTLREKEKMTQRELAEKLCISDKTISKWETDKGLPDIGILEELAKVLKISVTDLFTGEYRQNDNVSANMQKQHFYVCPICGNVVTAIGLGSYSCCGVNLFEQEISFEADEQHKVMIETMDGEYYVSVQHPMDKKHYISFIAYLTSDGVELKKQYPQQEASANFKKKGHGVICLFCNHHGMFGVRV
ncbi:MAG: helix-turn-helix domain-containing protein [Lachnospiraceae bacterium]|nr:helix-turn-helix domain-containing protein [Lachnospiraceae bacterium]